MKYWLVVTSPENFKLDRETLRFTLLGFSIRHKHQLQRMNVDDKVVYYIMGLQKLGAIARVTGDYVEDDTKVWTEDNQMWPARRSSVQEISLLDDELIDAKKLVPDLSFIEKKDNWGIYVRGSIREIPEEDFRLIESEMRKVMAERKPEVEGPPAILKPKRAEDDYEKAIMELPLSANSLHDRLGEMLEQVGSWMDYNAHTRHKIIPGHPYELDVAWLRGKNPEVAIEVQISGNITEAKDRLAQARNYNYRKVIMVLREGDLGRLNSIMKHDLVLRNWMDAWSIGAVYEMYTAGEVFFMYCRQLVASIYKEKKELEFVR